MHESIEDELNYLASDIRDGMHDITIQLEKISMCLQVIANNFEIARNYYELENLKKGVNDNEENRKN